MDVNESVTIMSGLRYMLGRSSYGVGCVCDHLKAKKSELMPKHIAVIKRDILEYIEEHPAMAYKQEWLDLIDYLEK